MNPRMPLISASRNGFDNTSAMGWDEWIYTYISNITNALLHACMFALRAHNIMESITHHHGAQNNLADNASQLVVPL